jgi:DNA mismatch endonuclease, patch repair protein
MRPQMSVSERMAAVPRRNTTPELALRAALRRFGVRVRLHDIGLPGTPDIVLPGSRIVVFVHGCFWHRHKGCPRTTSPKTNAAFWAEKFRANVARDASASKRLRLAGWRVFTVWECKIKADAESQAKRIAAEHRSALVARSHAKGHFAGLTEQGETRTRRG